jgi:hypothetical protein
MAKNKKHNKNNKINNNKNANLNNKKDNKNKPVHRNKVQKISFALNISHIIMFAIFIVLGIINLFVNIPTWALVAPIAYIVIVGFGWAFIAMFWSSFGSGK